MSRGVWFATSGRTRKGLTLLWIALFMFSLLLQSVRLAAPSPVAAASGLKADTVQGFEVDGNLLSGDASTNPGAIPAALLGSDPMANGDDWLQGPSHNNVVSLPSTNTPTAFLYTDAVDPGDTSAYGGGNKEDDTRDWVYVNNAGPNPKTDFKHIMAHARMVGNSAFAYLGAERLVNNGTMVVDFELNKKPFKQFSVGPAKPDRSVGDLLISLEYSNGGGNPIVTLYKISSVTNFASGQTVNFTKVSDALTIAAVHSATNFVDLTTSGFGYSVPAFDFAEASIDLSALGITTGCPGFSVGHIRSRTGGDPGNSQLKDAAPNFPIDLNNCGKVTIIKDAIPNSAQDFDFATTGGSSLSDFSLDDDSDNTLSNTKVFSQVVNGPYTVTEGAVAGWKLTDLQCNDANGSVSIANRKATLNVGPNEEITCTFTNTKLGKIIVEKQTIPDGSSGSFAFSGDVTGNLSDGQTAFTDNLLPGTYTSTEADPTPPFDLGSIACDDSDSSGSVATRTATFHLQAGETIKCTFTNVKRGTINIIKDAQPNDPQDFAYTTSGLSDFSLDDDGDNGNTLSNTKQFTNVVHGDYSVTETDVAGWELTNLVCNGDPDTGSSGTRSGNTANIHLNAGGSVTCTYTNVKAGHIIVDKVTNPGGDPQLFTFTPSYNGGATFQLADATAPNDSGDLKPGTYTVAETVPADWDLTSATCDDGSPVDGIVVSAGETVKCTFTNTKKGKVIDKKVMVGGTSTFTFTGTPAGSISTNNGTIEQVVQPGQYTSTEAAKAGWDLTGIDCDDSDSTGSTGTATATFNVNPGETVTCTFTNTKRGHIIVDKVTDPAADPQLFTFTPSYNGGTTFQLADLTTPNDSGALVPGDYSVAETVPAGWDLTSATCSDGSAVSAIHLGAGETVTCTFTNTKHGEVIVKKVMVGGTGTFTYTGTPAGSISTNGGTISADVSPGQYNSTEAAQTGWDLDSVTCDDNDSVGSVANSKATFNVSPGETVTCTFTNVKRGTIIVEKQTSPDGAEGLFTFTGDAHGSIGDDGQIIVNNLKPGTYTSSEDDPGPAFDLGAIECDDANSTTPSSGDVGTRTATFKLDPGETVKCVFTNAERGTITIIKNAQPDSAQDFHYDFTGLEGPVAFDLDDDADATLPNTQTFQNLQAGPYGVTESAVAGWDLTSLTCNAQGGSSAQINGATADLSLTEGGSITCVYVNSKPSISIVKTAGDAADGEEFVTPPGPVTYHYLVTNTGPVVLNDIVVWDDNGTPADTSDDFKADCPQTTLDPAESMTCTATVNVTANRTNIGTATGTSEGGTKVSAEDDAVVRVPSVNIDKSANDHLVEPGQTVTYTIHVQVVNGPVHDAIVTDTLPIGQTYVAGSSSPSEPTVSADGRTLTWHLGTLNDGNPAVTITYDVTIDADATTDVQTNVAEICVSDLPTCKTSEEHVTPQKPGIDIVKTAGDAADGEVFTTEPGNVTYTYVVTNTGPLALHDVTVTDDAGTPGDTSDDFEATCPKTTLDPGESMTCTSTVAVTVDTHNIAVAHGFTAEGNPVEADDDADVVILTHGLVIAKSNDAPLELLELPNGKTANLPTADEGDTVTFTLKYTLSGDPVTNGIITDVLPIGLTYVTDSATDSAEFIFDSYDATSRTLTWKAANVTASGTVTYKATVDKGASALPQPLENVATIRSDQTGPDSDTSDVFVPAPPKEATSPPTAPPTDTLEPSKETSNPGSSLMLILVVLGGLVLGIGFVTPVPERVRRRNRR
jgi:uncharacterized repeat protein (TIGR01451 family)/fimbrial isopeptide formation D2 family protein